jgi:hypothetical protein
MLLRAQGFKAVYAVLLGLNGWTDDVLYPEPSASDDPREKARFERAAAMATFFGGQARTEAGQAAGDQPALPRMAAPVASPVTPMAPRGKKREGC